MVDDILKKAKSQMQEINENLLANFASVRTGRANALILDRVKVKYYGTLTPINQMAAIKVVDAHTLVIEPWDKSCLEDIVHAINQSDIGISPNSDGSVIRLSFPPLTEERRKEFVKQCHIYAEEARVSIRNIRREANSSLEKLVKTENLPEDDLRHAEQNIQKLTDDQIAQVDNQLSIKEKDLMSI